MMEAHMRYRINAAINYKNLFELIRYASINCQPDNIRIDSLDGFGVVFSSGITAYKFRRPPYIEFTYSELPRSFLPYNIKHIAILQEMLASIHPLKELFILEQPEYSYAVEKLIEIYNEILQNNTITTIVNNTEITAKLLDVDLIEIVTPQYAQLDDTGITQLNQQFNAHMQQINNKIANAMLELELIV